MIMALFQIRKQRHREVNSSAQGYTASQWQLDSRVRVLNHYIIFLLYVYYMLVNV